MTDREINEAVARKLGWDKDSGRDSKDNVGPRIISPNGSRQDFFPDYCHDISAAWEVVEWLRKSAIFINIECNILWSKEIVSEVDTSNYCVDLITSSGLVQEIADTAPMAICLAFLKLGPNQTLPDQILPG